MRKRILLVFILAALWLGAGHNVRAESGVEITPQPPEYTFGDKITFRATLTSDIPPQNIKLIIETPDASSFLGATEFIPPDQIIYVYSLKNRPLRAFSTIVYRYRVTLENEEVYTSPDYSFRYLDNRYTWQELEDEAFLVSWYEDEVTFAQEILDTARAGLERFEVLLPNAKDDGRVDIYAYSSALELQSTLLMSGQTWVAGHADPELGAIVVSLPPGPERSLEIDRQVPHELAHILLYQIMGEEYQNLPQWLNEGIASQMETFPNPDYRLYLEEAYEEGNLIPVEELCLIFPSDPATSFLAYAEATSLTGYIKDYYGAEGIRNLISAYEQGLECNRGVEVALELDLRQLERDWQKAVFDSATNQFIEASLAFLPWLVIFGAIFSPLVGFVVLRGLKTEYLEWGDK